MILRIIIPQTIFQNIPPELVIISIIELALPSKIAVIPPYGVQV